MHEYAAEFFVDIQPQLSSCVKSYLHALVIEELLKFRLCDLRRPYFSPVYSSFYLEVIGDGIFQEGWKRNGVYLRRNKDECIYACMHRVERMYPPRKCSPFVKPSRVFARVCMEVWIICSGCERSYGFS